ncbi:M23 family metallopeptidase [Alteromonadaceae bacterium BrNp21-10]|nr:M23 family metallopeptidase [Alteromonadaceae bacterium BrNp21-10]
MLLMFPVYAIAVELTGQLTQGSMIVGKTQPGTQVFLDDKPLKVSPEGNFVFGFGRDAELLHQLKWQEPNQTIQQQNIVLTQREYDVQRIEGLPPKMVTPDPAVTARIREDNRKVGAARKIDDDRNDFAMPFIWAAKGRISGVYGSQRVLNGQPKRPHFGVDVAGAIGTPVVAPADGIVTLWEPDMYYSGGTMLIDHGHGISSSFLHLSKSHVKQGQKVKQGELVAEIGNTGRVTGPHLDWRINWFKERLDPALLLPAQAE